MKNNYTIDPTHSTAHFIIRHMMITNVRGAFNKVQGTVSYDSDNPSASSVDVTIDAGSINTGDPQRDGHLKTGEFLDVEKYPSMTFKSTKVEKTGDDELDITGDLTIHGVTKEVVLKAEGPTAEGKDPYGNLRVGASAKTKIKRSEFGVSWNGTLETGGILLGDELKIEIDLSLIKS